jgi:hypothetical protein
MTKGTRLELRSILTKCGKIKNSIQERSGDLSTKKYMTLTSAIHEDMKSDSHFLAFCIFKENLYEPRPITNLCVRFDATGFKEGKPV